MPSKLSADAARANVCVAFYAKQKARSPSSAPSFLTVAGRWAGLSDDLGSLREDRDSNRREQSEGGGDRSKLGHGVFPHGVQCLLTMRCRGRRAWMRCGEKFLRFVFASLFKQKRGPCDQDPRFHSRRRKRECGAAERARARCPFERCVNRGAWTQSAQMKSAELIAPRFGGSSRAGGVYATIWAA